MDFKTLASDLAKLSPEERAALAVLFTGGVAPVAGEQIPEVDLALFEEVKGDFRKMYPRLDDARINRLAAEAMKQKKERKPPKPPRAEMVYFFQQHGLFVTEKIEADEDSDGGLKKTGYFMPPRVIAVDDKSAGKLFWKHRSKYSYLGRSPGNHWARARADGMGVSEAFAVEFEEFKKNPDQTPPLNREKTFFAGTKPHSIARGREISWKDGLKQQGEG